MNAISTPAIEIRSVEKQFGSFRALKNVTLDIKSGEFFTLLGPSGCGKTTLLRLIAGFEELTSGEIYLHGQPLAKLPPNKREINTVFQQYALFPLMTVIQNVEFGLLRKGFTRVDARKRAAAVLKLVHMEGYEQRMPTQLSGGQQQRVALARALAPEPKVLLLDEPLSALDLKLRQKVRLELKSLQRNTGITFIFVTHDQEEALTMSDRIAVMSEGVVQQVGTPVDIYERPRNSFVADFIGETNLLEAEAIKASGDIAEVHILGGRPFLAELPEGGSPASSHVSLRPENLALSNPEESHFSGTAIQHVYLGTDMQIAVRCRGDADVLVRIPAAEMATLPNVGDVVHLRVRDRRARLVAD